MKIQVYNKRGTAEVAAATIKEGKLAVNWTRLSCHRFRRNEVRLWLSVIPTLSGRLALPNRIRNWSLTSLPQRLVKSGGPPPVGLPAGEPSAEAGSGPQGGRLVKHARYYWLQLAEGHLTRQHFGSMLRRVAALPLPNG